MKRFAIAFLAITMVGVSVVHAQLPALVINEIDYDQVGTDAAEFVEIKNNGATVADLSAYAVVFVNGTGTVIYDTIALPAVSLLAGDYFVICANAGTVTACDLDDAPNTDFIQNGSPDAVAIVTTTMPAVVLDTMSYEGNTGAPYTEGTGTIAADSNTIAFISLSRFPDGADTNDNDADASLRCITPGSANLAATTGCQSVAVQPTVWSSMKSLYR